MNLIISVCCEKLHEYEFVKPIIDIVKKNFVYKHYSEVNLKDIEKSKRVIICGTSLMDFEYLNKLNSFLWIKAYNKPVLGICAGAQIIGSIFGGELKDELFIGNHIGHFEEDFSTRFFDGEFVQKVYSLHSKVVTLPENFLKLNEDVLYPTAFKKKDGDVYGVMFHPEVHNPEFIRAFLKLK